MKYAAAALALAGAAMAKVEEPESTVFSTAYFTITSCAPEVTNCPARSTVVSSSVVPMTTSTIYTTKVSTVTSCAPEITNCPAGSTVVVTATEAISTTVCPVTETGAKPTPSAPAPITSKTEAVPPAKPTTASGEKPVVSKSEGVPPAVPTTEKPAVPTTPAAVPSVSKPATLVSSPAAPVCPSVSVKTISTSVTTVIPTVIYETVSVPCATATGQKPSAGIPGVPTGGNSTVPAPTKTPVVTAGAAGLSGSAFVAAFAGVAAYILA